MEKLLQKDSVPQPKIYRKGQNMAFHIRAVKRYLDAISMTRQASMATVLLNSLEDSVQEEVCAQLGYDQHADDYTWLEKCLLQMYQPQASVVSPLLRLLSVRQKPDQEVTDYGTELRVEAYRQLPTNTPNKEELLLTAFLNGLRDRVLATAIQSLNVQCIDDAIRVAQHESKRTDTTMDPSSHLRALVSDQKNGRTLQEEINSLKEQVARLQD